ncbi:glycosyltransferase family 4 protein [Negadavirga shengliensis]|uniref:Glycosyltransferase family 4 protein n=1 Tax=Negadavirga shengliensis TaxID=1389218 RepID=A0ABV9T3R2_9BACT
MDLPKRVLIITYYWPPSAGSGVQRWLKFVKYLPEFGWEPVVFTPENPDFELKDPSLVKEVPATAEVLRFPIWEPYQLLRWFKKEKIKDPAVILENRKKTLLDKLAIWLRANFILPDPRVYWVKPSVKFIAEMFEANDFKAIVTTGPPHSMHLIGRNIKRKKNIPWIADFRDPWSTWEFLDALPMNGRARKKHREMEASVFKEADAILTISPTFKMELERIANRKIYLLTNGFDREDLPKGFPPAPENTPVFEIVYSGVIDSIRDPLPFLQALKKSFEKGEGKVRLTFVGKVSTSVIQYIEEDKWLTAHVFLAGYVSHAKVFEYYQRANLLLLILTHTKNAQGNIPGKLFEYLATGRDILALGDPAGDTAQIIRQADAGSVFKHEDIEGISHFLTTVKGSAGKSRTAGQLEIYDRKTLTKQLADILDGISGTSGTAH